MSSITNKKLSKYVLLLLLFLLRIQQSLSNSAQFSCQKHQIVHSSIELSAVLFPNYKRILYITTFELLRTSSRSRAVVQRCSVKKVFLEISQNSQENTCARVFIKKRLWQRCFPLNFVKFLRILFFIEQLWWLLLEKFTSQYGSWISQISTSLKLKNMFNFWNR